MNNKEKILRIKAELETSKMYLIKALNHERDLMQELTRQAKKVSQ